LHPTSALRTKRELLLSAGATGHGEGKRPRGGSSSAWGMRGERTGHGCREGCQTSATRTCKAGALETSAHALFGCEFYDAIRPPPRAAAEAWCHEPGISDDDAGCAAAL
jgi:hypothetical protein